MSRIVVVKFPGNYPAVGFQKAADAVTERSTPAMANMQWAGGVGRDKLHLHFVASTVGIATVVGAVTQYVGNYSGCRCLSKEKVDKARARNVGFADYVCWRVAPR